MAHFSSILTAAAAFAQVLDTQDEILGVTALLESGAEVEIDRPLLRKLREEGLLPG